MKLKYDPNYVGYLPWKCPECGGRLWQDGEIYCENYQSMAELQEELQREGEQDEYLQKMIAQRKKEGTEDIVCDFETYPCENDGTYVILLNLGPQDIKTFGIYCSSCTDTEYWTADDPTINAMIEKAFPDADYEVYYHPTWIEELEKDGTTLVASD